MRWRYGHYQQNLLVWYETTGAMTALVVTSGEEATLVLRRHLIGRAVNG